ncbi:MAG: flippase [Rhodothermales bacterium]
MSSNSKNWIERLKGQDNLAQFIRGSGGGFLIKMLSTLVIFASTMALTRLLGKQEWGAYSFAIACLSTCLIIARYGFNKSAIRYIASYRSKKEWGLINGFVRYSQRTSFKIAIGLSLGFGLIIYLSRSYIIAKYGDDAFYNCLLIALLFLPLVARLEIQEGMLDGLKRVVLSQLSMRTLRPALIAIAMIITYYWTDIGRITREAGDIVLHAELAIFINLAATICAVFLSYYLVKSAVPKQVGTAQPEYNKKEWFSTSQDMMLTSGFNYVLISADSLMLGIMLNTDAVGVYRIASQVAAAIVIALTAMNGILHPIVADLHANNKRQELQRIVSLGANAVFALSIIGGLILYFAADFLPLLFGAEYVEPIPLLRILIFGQIFNACAGPAVLLLNMTGHQRDAAKIMAIGALLNLVLNGILITSMGIKGAAIATIVTTLLWNIGAAMVVWYRLKIVSFALWWPKNKKAS